MSFAKPYSTLCLSLGWDLEPLSFLTRALAPTSFTLLGITTIDDAEGVMLEGGGGCDLPSCLVPHCFCYQQCWPF